MGGFFWKAGDDTLTRTKTNGWNLKMVPWKRRNIDPNHQSWGSMLVFRGVTRTKKWWFPLEIIDSFKEEMFVFFCMHRF